MPIHGYPGNVITANPTAPTVSSASGVWTTEQQLINQSAGRWPMAATQISRSLRFNSADSAYLNRTPASAGNRQIFTWSGWVKRSASGNVALFTARTDDSNRSSILFESENLRCFNFSGGSVTSNLVTSAVFRDFSAWYHVVISMNTTTQVGKIYVNGVEQTLGTNTVGLNSNFFFNNTNAHAIGRTEYSTPEGYFNGYMTEINFVDGLALDPSYFGFNNSDTGVWTPRQYTGAYGTNGFYLNFSDNSGTTSTTLGKDYSGNGNNWTPNNFSVTAGAGNDSMVDSPTSYGTDTGIGGEVRGNYCVLNPVNPPNGVTITNGNLDFSCSNDTTPREAFATVGVKTGKWYFEGLKTNSSIRYYIGIIQSNYKPGDGISYGKLAFDTNSGTNRITMMAIDFDAGKYWTGNQGTWSSGDPSTGTGGTSFTVGSIDWVPLVGGYAETPQPSAVGSINFGQRAFSYTAPSGFKALCTQNLPTPTIGATSTTQANDYFDITLRTTVGGTGGSITTLNFQPDFLWSKLRNTSSGNVVWDAVRGVDNYLVTNTTAAAVTASTWLTSFNSNGYTYGTGDFASGNSAVDWAWKANGAGSTNTAGTITSTVSANTTSGFSIVTYTGTGANATVGHGLGVAPSMIIVKVRSTTNNWATYHAVLGNTKALLLDTTDAQLTSSLFWNNTSPTSSVFSVSTGNSVNNSGQTYVAYCFAPVAGYSAFGSYTGNGSTDGPFVYTGFRPRYVLIKRSAGDIGNWVEHDTARESYNLATTSLYPNLSNAETVAASQSIDILSNGFKLRNTSGDINASGGTYIYAAFAEHPFKYSLAR